MLRDDLIAATKDDPESRVWVEVLLCAIRDHNSLSKALDGARLPGTGSVKRGAKAILDANDFLTGDRWRVVTDALSLDPVVFWRIVSDYITDWTPSQIEALEELAHGQ